VEEGDALPHKAADCQSGTRLLRGASNVTFDFFYFDHSYYLKYCKNVKI
jgi:hypothetical protein